MAYMKKVTDAKTDSGIGGGWFKVSHAGLNTASKTPSNLESFSC
jgi:cellulase